jgi:hypothetical protein
MVPRRKEDRCRMTDRAGLDDRGAGQDSPQEEGWSGAPKAPDLEKLAQDWITLWQSELSAMAADRELQESWRTTAVLWAGVATAMLNAMTSTTRRKRDERSPQRAGTEPAPGAKAPAAAPDPRDAEIERLARHIAALEARLGALERGGSARRPARRKR